jgi:hypothetical protein
MGIMLAEIPYNPKLDLFLKKKIKNIYPTTGSTSDNHLRPGVNHAHEDDQKDPSESIILDSPPTQ